MNVALAVLIVVVATGGAVAVMLVVRRGAPDGSYFNDGDRAAGVFGVLATGFSVLLGFVVFLAFTSYETTQSGAETEARTVVHQVETALLLPADVRQELVGQLECYARSVVGVQWELMESGDLGDQLNPWAVALFGTIQPVEPESAAEEAAYSEWLDQTIEREEGRQDRVHGANGVIPTPLWIVLYFTSAVIFLFMLFFADSGERAIVQAMLMGSVVAVIAAMLLLLWFLDHPFHDGVGGLHPTAMARSLVIIDEGLQDVDLTISLPCDEAGRPTGS